MTASQEVALTLDEVWQLARDALRAQQVSDDVANTLAECVMRAERDGPSSHGLFILPSLLSGLRCGWINSKACARIVSAGAAALRVDGDNGFAQPGLEQAREELMRMARAHGIAVLTQRNAHHVTALRCDIEPYAEAGLVAMLFVATRRRVAPLGGHQSYLGTNPMAFASPIRGRRPLVWDMATSAVSITDVRMMGQAGLPVPPGVGIDRYGQPATEADAILDGGALLAFGGHKGAALSLMVEVMAAALSGGQFAMEDRSAEVSGAASANGGQTLIVIDPERTCGSSLAERLADWTTGYLAAGGERLPGDGRLPRREASERHGIRVSRALLEQLRSAASH